MSQTAYSESIDLAFSQEAEPWAQDGLQIVDSLTDAFSEQFDAAAAFLASAEKAASNDVNEDTPSGYDKAEEDALLARAKDGDEAAYSTLFLKYEPSVRRLLMRFQTPEDTNDILQDVHIRGWRGLKNFREDSRFHTWIYTIARNTSIKFSNLNKKHKGCSYEDLFDSDLYDLSLEAGNNPLGFLEDEETLQAFIAALEILPDDMKKTFRLRIIEMKSCEETAAALGILEGTVKSRIFKAKKHIEKECAARGIDLQLTKTVKKPKKKAPIAKTVSADSKCGPR
ncbi:MAG: sigma-70 family RNA polymerase sigma factor, partial [Alphaproteobacteria bacterium]|nr:sigma-70 family RNA polymerase sigma factor [Alphaproteobacteria bacterium]